MLTLERREGEVVIIQHEGQELQIRDTSRMTAIGIIEVLVIILSFVYVVISIMAYFNVKDSDSKRIYIFPTWFLQKSIFNDYGKRLCLIGFILFVIVFGGAAVLFYDSLN